MRRFGDIVSCVRKKALIVFLCVCVLLQTGGLPAMAAEGNRTYLYNGSGTDALSPDAYTFL